MPEKTVTVPSPQFSSVSDLITRSWERFKISWKSLLLITLAIYAISFAGIAVLMIILFGGGALTAINSGGIDNNLMQVLGTMAPLAIVLFLIYIVLMLVVGVVSGAAMMLAVDKAEQKPSIGSLLQMGIKLLWPMVLTSLLVAFLTLGGIFVFIIPGIIISVYLVFSNYEVVLNGQKTSQALKNSATIIGQNFGVLFLRYLVVIGIAIAIGMVGGILQGATEKVAGLSGLINLVVMVAQMAMSGYVIVYMYFLYKEARALTDFKRPASLSWMWIISIIGWVIGVIMMVAMGAGMAALFKSDVFKDAINEELQLNQDGSSAETFMNGEEVDVDALLEQYGSEMSAEDKELLRNVVNSTESE